MAMWDPQSNPGQEKTAMGDIWDTIGAIRIWNENQVILGNK